jgi:predicted transcriptional regulator
MSTTTIRLPDELKTRIARAAKRAGTTSHNFILEAIAEKAEMVEQRNDFIATAEARYANIVESGKTIPWKDMQRHLADRMTGKKSSRPAAKKLAR